MSKVAKGATRIVGKIMVGPLRPWIETFPDCFSCTFPFSNGRVFTAYFGYNEPYDKAMDNAVRVAWHYVDR